MEKEDKELLLKDLSTRLPYGVICHINDFPTNFNPRKLIGIIVEDPDNIILNFLTYDIYYPSISRCLSEIKPYLRPMSSMTEEEVDEFTQFDVYADGEYVMPNHEVVDWLNKNMFDYRGLIPKGLAIAITKENNPYKTIKYE